MFYFYFSLIYLSLVSPFLLNLIFGLQSSSLGFVVGQLILLLFSYRIIYSKYSLKKIIFAYVAILFLATFCLASSFYSLSVMLNALILVFTIGLTLINSIFFCEYVKHNKQIFKRFINFSWYLSIAISVVSFIFLERGFFIFGEASFFALFFGPLTCVYSFVNKRYFIPAIIILFYSYYIPNLTIVLFLFVILIYKLPLKYLLLSLVLIFILATPKIFGEYVQSRVTLDASEANASSLLYLINWINIITRFEELIVLGDGVGFKSSKVELGNDYVSQLRLRYTDLNPNGSGTFFTAKLVQSIGLAGAIPGAFLLYMMVKNFFRLRKEGDSFEYSMQFILFASLMPAFFFRASGLLSFSTFLFVFSVVYIFMPKINNRHPDSSTLYNKSMVIKTPNLNKPH